MGGVGGVLVGVFYNSSTQEQSRKAAILMSLQLLCFSLWPVNVTVGHTHTHTQKFTPLGSASSRSEQLCKAATVRVQSLSECSERCMRE